MSRLERLESARDALANAIPEADGQRLPGLVREYRATLAEIESLAPPSEQKGTPLDELEKRRAARKSGAAGGSSTPGEVV